MSDAGTQQEKATLTIGDRTAEFPLLSGTDGAPSVDISTFTRQTGHTTLDYGFVNTAATKSAITFIDGDQGILRYRGYPIEQLAQNSTYLEVAWLLIYGELPTRRRARRLRRPHPSPHAAARRPQALLLGAAAHRAPDVGALVGGLGALDLLRARVRPAQPRARRAQHDPHAREAAGHRRVRAQEEHRAGVPLPRQLAELRRQLPQAQLRRALRAVRGQPGDVACARAAADPARGPRAERLDLDGAPRRLDRREPVLVDLGRHQRAVRSAARRRERGRARHARRASATPARACSASSSGSRTRKTASSSWASVTASTRTTTRARSS